MSDAFDLVIAFSFLAACTIAVRRVGPAKAVPDWWFALAAVPLFSLGMTLAIAVFPRDVPAGWQEGDFDTGRADFVALIFFAVVVPVAYLAVAAPLTFAIRRFRNRLGKP